MNALRIDVGVHTILHVNLTDVDFTDIKEIVFTIKNPSPKTQSQSLRKLLLSQAFMK